MLIFRLLFEFSLELDDDFVESIRQIDVEVVELGPIVGTD